MKVASRNHVLTSRQIFAAMLALSLVALLESIWNGAIIRHNENSWDENSKILAQNPYFIDNLNTFVVLSQVKMNYLRNTIDARLTLLTLS